MSFTMEHRLSCSDIEVFISLKQAERCLWDELSIRYENNQDAAQAARKSIGDALGISLSEGKCVFISLVHVLRY
jgi:hypothetical protein